MKGNGIPSAPMVVLPRTELTEYVSPEQVEEVARAALNDIITQLAPKSPP